MLKQILEQENNNPAIIHVEPEQAVKELLTSLKVLESTKQEIKDKLDQDLLEQLDLCEDRIAATEKEIKESGSSGRVYAPKEWIGKNIKLILLEPLG